jgi:hypothetical protein
MQGSFSTLFGKLMVQITRKQRMKIQCYLSHAIFLHINVHSVRYGKGNAPNLLLVRLIHPNRVLRNSICVILLDMLIFILVCLLTLLTIWSYQSAASIQLFYSLRAKLQFVHLGNFFFVMLGLKSPIENYGWLSFKCFDKEQFTIE